jgi:hypothetical protein
MDEKIAHLQKVQFKNYYKPQEYVEKPRYNSTWEKTKEEHMQARANLNLEPSFVDINPEKLPDPGIKWVNRPKVNCTSVLHDKRKRDNL